MTQTKTGAEGGKEKLPLHWKMAIGFGAGLLLGMVAYYVSGADAEWVQWLTTYVTQPAGQLFLRLIFMLIIPLLFSALVVGIAEMGDVHSLGRVGWKTLGYTVGISTIAAARSEPSASICSAAARSTPTPGCSQLTSTRPITTAMPDTTTV